MSITRRLRTFACCTILEFGTLMGVPMRPEQIQDLMRAMNVPKVAQTNPDECTSGDGADPGASTGLHRLMFGGPGTGQNARPSQGCAEE